LRKKSTKFCVNAFTQAPGKPRVMAVAEDGREYARGGEVDRHLAGPPLLAYSMTILCDKEANVKHCFGSTILT
jgi:hypothetical protein